MQDFDDTKTAKGNKIIIMCDVCAGREKDLN